MLIDIVLDAHEQMVDWPVRLWLHAREIVDTAVALIEAIPLSIEIHREKITHPLFIDGLMSRLLPKRPVLECMSTYVCGT